MSKPRHETGTPQAERTHTGSMVALAILLAAAWLLWSGLYKPLLLALGLISCVLVLVIAQRMRLFDTDILELRFLARLVRFWGWLGREVVRSSLEVTRAVLNPKLPISPSVAEFDTRCEHPVDQALLGNSITLTPGTLTLSIEGRRFVVHALTESGARDVMAGEMDRRVSELRRR